MGTFLGGIVIDLANLQVAAAPGTVPEAVLFSLGLFAGPGIALGGFVAWLWARRVRLSRSTHGDIRRRLQPDAAGA